METEVCRSCGNELLEEGDFCGDCGQRAQCGACQVALKPNKGFCIGCGAAVGTVGTVGATSTNESLITPLPGMNTLRLKEDKNSRLLELSFTDRVAESMSSPLTAYMAGHVGVPQPKSRPFPTRDVNIIDGEAIALPTPAGEAANAQSSVSAMAATSILTDGLERIFSLEGERLRLRDPRLRGDDTKMDTARRLTHLFLYAHSRLGRPRVPLADLHAILDEARVDDSNTRVAASELGGAMARW